MRPLLARWNTLRPLLLAALLLTAACGADLHRLSPGPEAKGVSSLPGLGVLESLPLGHTPPGPGGHLELLVDSRLTRDRLDHLWETGEGMEGLRPAVLQVRDGKGDITDRLVLERPLARFEPERLTPPGSTLWLLTVDYSAPAGSYNGPITFAVNVEGNRLHLLEAMDAQGKSTPIRLMRSLKSNWRLEPLPPGGGQDILSVSTSPDFDRPGEFLVTYERLSFDGRHWVRRVRQQPGFWEADGDFPSRESFP